jgi:hypothetical protein
MVKFEDELKGKLLESRSAITVKQYIQKLRTLNDDKPITSFAFLKDQKTTDEKIEALGIKFSTKISYYTAISATLSCYKAKEKLYKQYQAKMIEMANQLKTDLSKNEKTEQQKKSMIPWNDIIIKRDELQKHVEGLEEFNRKDWDKLLQYVLIRLYSDIPPRRVQDFSYMVVDFFEPEVLDDNKNYYIVGKGEMIFNKYKTKKIYGTQRFKIPEVLEDAMMVYFSAYFDLFHPTKEFKLLVNHDGSDINPTVGIGRLLNKAFDAPVGASALRHIYVSEKFEKELTDRKATAEKMGHTIHTQAEYIKH